MDTMNAQFVFKEEFMLSLPLAEKTGDELWDDMISLCKTIVVARVEKLSPGEAQSAHSKSCETLLHSFLAARLVMRGQPKLARWHATAALSIRRNSGFGCWALGRVAEKEGDLVAAHNHYEIAALCSPGFTLILEDYSRMNRLHSLVSKALHIPKAQSHPLLRKKKVIATTAPEPESKSDTREKTALPVSLVAWNSFLLEAIDTTGEINFETWSTLQIQRKDFPTSLFWIASGQYRWYLGIKKCYAKMATSIRHEQMDDVWKAINDLYNDQDTSQKTLRQEQERILGSAIDEFNLADLVGAYAHLMGRHIISTKDHPPFIPTPRYLGWLPNPQLVAMLFAIAESARNVSSVFEHGVKMSPAVLSACTVFYHAAGFTSDFPVHGVPATPEEVMEFCEESLCNGMTWRKGMREFVSLQYRGTVLYSAFLNLAPSLHKDFLTHMKWAREFIAIADKKWKVTATKSYLKHGSCFQPSLRVGIMVAELDTSRSLCHTNIPNVDQMLKLKCEFRLASAIVSLANKIDVKCESRIDSKVFEALYLRKPCAAAHTVSAECLLDISTAAASDKDCSEMLKRLYHRPNIDVQHLHSFVAHHFHQAAQTELADDGQAYKLWWGRAGSTVRSPGYTLGKLRHSIQKAKEAKTARDDSLFGTDHPRRVGVLELQARAVECRFRLEDDSFVLPQVRHEAGPNNKISLYIGDELIRRNIPGPLDKEKSCKRQG